MALTIIPEARHPLALGFQQFGAGLGQGILDKLKRDREQQDLAKFLSFNAQQQNYLAGQLPPGVQGPALLAPTQPQFESQRFRDMQSKLLFERALGQILGPQEKANLALTDARTEQTRSATAVNKARVDALRRELEGGVPIDSTEFERIMATPVGLSLSKKDRIAAYRRQLGLDPKPAVTKQMPERTLQLLNQAQQSIDAAREAFRRGQSKDATPQEKAAIKGKSMADTLRAIKQRIFSLYPEAIGSMVEINQYFATQGLSPEDEL